VAEPGVCPAGLATGSHAGAALLCVAAVTRAKGLDVLLDAYALLDRDVPLVLIGSPWPGMPALPDAHSVTSPGRAGPDHVLVPSLPGVIGLESIGEAPPAVASG
jgi:hypothetical protein